MQLKIRGSRISQYKAKRKRIGEDNGSWLMSYADTVTLLLCFFIIFFAEQSKKAEESILIELSRDMKQQQTGSYTQKPKGHHEDMLSMIESGAKTELAKAGKNKKFTGVEKRRKEVLIRLYEKDFFQIGHYRLKPSGYEVLKGVAKMLKPYQEKVLIKVEGHSDSLAVQPNKIYDSNLDLSSLRASKAAHALMAYGFDEDRIRVVGYGSSRPLVSDRGPASEGSKYLPENGVQNRRIELRIIVSDPEADDFMEFGKVL